MSDRKKVPLVSVIMSTYNNERYIESSVWSVLSQDFKDFELVIINDGSTDNTQKIIEKIQQKDNRIRLFNQKNQGVVKSRNRGLNIAKGKYIAILDGDDQWLPHKLMTQVEEMLNNPKLILISGAIELINENDIPLGFALTSNLDQDVKRAMTITNPIVHSSVLFRKDIALRYGGYPDFCPAEDYKLFSQILDDGGEFYTIPYPIVRYRHNLQGISHTNKIEQDSLTEKIALENWEELEPKVLTRKQIRQKTNDLLKSSVTLEFGVQLKHYFLSINTRIGYRMIKKGYFFDGARQLFNVASTGRTGLKIVINNGKGSLIKVLKSG